MDNVNHRIDPTTGCRETELEVTHFMDVILGAVKWKKDPQNLGDISVRWMYRYTAILNHYSKKYVDHSLHADFCW